VAEQTLEVFLEFLFLNLLKRAELAVRKKRVGEHWQEFELAEKYLFHLPDLAMFFLCDLCHETIDIVI
jgi:hypothetical protein